MTTRWYVVQTQPHSEGKADLHLRRQGFLTYLPRYQRQRRHARRIETVFAPLFPRYMFVKVDVTAQRWRPIYSTIGVSRLVCNGEWPAPVPCEVIHTLKGREDPRGLVQLDRQPRFARGDKIRVLDGVFSTCFGLFEGMHDDERVAILLDLLGRKVRVVLAADFVTAA
jgi:transcriptional antiterminator RfaH